MHSVDPLWKKTQEEIYIRWVNGHLINKGIQIHDLGKDFSDGRNLCALIETITHSSVGKWHKHPVVTPQKMDNLALALNFLRKEGFSLLNVDINTIYKGNVNVILGLLWQMMARYQIILPIQSSKDQEIKKAEKSIDNLDITVIKEPEHLSSISLPNINNMKLELLAWINETLAPDYNVKNFNKDWTNGIILCALINNIKPGICNILKNLQPQDAFNNCRLGLRLSEQLGIIKMIIPEELSENRVEENIMVAFLSQFRNIKITTPVDQPIILKDYSHQIKVYGDGLQEALVGVKISFIIDLPDFLNAEVYPGLNKPLNLTDIDISKALEYHRDGKSYFLNECPRSNSNNDKPIINVDIVDSQGVLVPFKIVQTNNRSYTIIYTPFLKGYHEVRVSILEKHIPGSVFLVKALNDISLGGEGCIRVFYSTTSCSEKYKKDFEDLTSLLTDKKIHLKKNFEPWHAIDLMNREDRELVFQKAQTRNLPIVFIDDSFIGDFDTLQVKENTGELDTLLKLNEDVYISMEEHMERLKIIALEEQKKEKEKNESEANKNKSPGFSRARSKNLPSPWKSKHHITESSMNELTQAVKDGIIDNNEIQKIVTKNIDVTISTDPELIDSNKLILEKQDVDMPLVQSEPKDIPEIVYNLDSPPLPPPSMHKDPVRETYKPVTSSSTPGVAPSQQSQNNDGWFCTSCTYHNPPLFLCCDMCGAVKP